MIFYISTQGHTASGWIARSFSNDARVICWHAIRTIPPAIQDRPYRNIHIPSGWDRDAADIFAEDLKFCADTSGGNIFGAIHTIWGLTAKKAIEERGGNFAGMIRHPIMQMNSMLAGFTARELSQHVLRCTTYVDHQDVIKRLANNMDEGFELGSVKFKDANLKQKLKKLYYRTLIVSDEYQVKSKGVYSNPEDVDLMKIFFSKNINMLAYIFARLFIHSASRVIDEHARFNSTLEQDSLIVSEEITSSQSYFESKFNLITGLSSYSGSWEDISNSSHVNFHAVFQDKRSITPQKIWNTWTAPMQEYFLKKIDRHPELINRYREYDYWLPL